MTIKRRGAEAEADPTSGAIPSNLELRLELQGALLIVAGEPWVVQSFNSAAQSCFGEALAVGMLFSELIPQVNEPALRRRLSRGRDVRFDFDPQQLHRAPYEFSCVKSASLEGSVLLEGRELSRAHAAEVMLTTYSKLVEEKSRELEAAINARDEFLSMMSHELRTPLNLIIGFSESLVDEIYGEINDEQLSVLERICTSGRELLSLLNHLLQLSRLRSGKLELRRRNIDLEPICRQALRRCRKESTEARLRVNFESSGATFAFADERWSLQLIENLLSNAIKFTHQNRWIGVRLGAGPLGVRVTVWDEGIGISRDAQKLIFQPFTQVESSLAREYGGSGLGLSVVSELMRLHEGRVSVESELGEGSSFHLDLPAARAAVGEELTPPESLGGD